MEGNKKDVLQESLANWKIKMGVLCGLCCQNAGHALVARYSQGVLRESYSGSEVVLVAEIIKLFFSGYLVLAEKADSDPGTSGFSRLFGLLKNAQKIVILVILYAMANILSYFALARVDAALYTVLLQLKILTTAAFSVLFLNRIFSGAKWRALVLLVLGCILVASPAFDRADEPAEVGEPTVAVFDVLSGIVAVLAMVAISGYAAVYFEGMLKKEKVTIWERNFQLAFYSVLLLSLIIVSEMTYSSPDTEESAPPPANAAAGLRGAVPGGVMHSLQNFKFPVFFKGWTTCAVILALIQAAGGLLVAATLKYADSILKTLATSGSIVLSAALGRLLLGADLDIFVSIGCCCTILAICNYSMDTTD
eukprot:gene33818-40919_t